LRQRFREHQVREHVVDQAAAENLHLAAITAFDAALDVFKVLEQPLVLFINEVDAGLVLGRPRDLESHCSSLSLLCLCVRLCGAMPASEAMPRTRGQMLIWISGRTSRK